MSFNVFYYKFSDVYYNSEGNRGRDLTITPVTENPYPYADVSAYSLSRYVFVHISVEEGYVDDQQATDRTFRISLP